jgi:hypothetical protein
MNEFENFFGLTLEEMLEEMEEWYTITEE